MSKKTAPRMFAMVAASVFLFDTVMSYAGTMANINPTKPFSEDNSLRCNLTMLTPGTLGQGVRPSSCKILTDGMPRLEGCEGVWVFAGCSGSLVDSSQARLWFSYYRYNEEHKDNGKSFSGNIYRKNLQSFINSGAGDTLQRTDHKPLRLPDGTVLQRPPPTDISDTDILERSPDGVPRLALPLADCGQVSIRTDVTPISGPNWDGWMWEQIFPKPKPRTKITKAQHAECQRLLDQKMFATLDELKLCGRYEMSNQRCMQYTPEYRCVALVFGNDKMSASIGPQCFLRKRVNNLNKELSFDFFMDMIKTIRFNEGDPIANLKITP